MIQLPECIKHMAGKSAYELVMEYRATDEDYEQLQDKCDAAYEAIKEKLGSSHLLHRLEEIQNQIASKEDDLIYLKGMIDCAVFLKAIRLI